MLDKEFKNYMLQHYGPSLGYHFVSLQPDYCTELNGETVYWECERSSRGMMSNVVKYLMLDKPISAIFVVTNHHLSKHRADLYKAIWIYQNTFTNHRIWLITEKDLLSNNFERRSFLSKDLQSQIT